MGLSLVPRDIEWFENEECEDSRVRTIEPFEVELKQMANKEVIGVEGGEYSYEMHVLRALVTNLFPADYDYEAPLQSLLHRAYITAHGRDRWWRQTCGCWYLPFSLGLNVCYTGVFVGTGCCCCGLGQGHEPGQYRWPDLCLCCFEE